MTKNTKGIVLTIAITLVLFIGAALLFRGSGTTASTVAQDQLAQCMAESGAKFYGAFWCPHCQDQKAAFGNTEYLPYVECSTPDGQGQTEECMNAGIQSYPTWEFGNGQRVTGNIALASLAEITGCSYTEPGTSNE